jgi:hypothetical protein
MINYICNISIILLLSSFSPIDVGWVLIHCICLSSLVVISVGTLL